MGLGNIWRFPYVAGESGGGAFVLIYLICVAIVGIPIMIAEVAVGRRGRQSPINTMRSLSALQGLHPWWSIVGWMGVAAGFMILSFYAVVAGWTLAYIFRAGTGMFTAITAEQSTAVFSRLLADPEKLLAWHTIFMVLTVMIVSRGVKGGLEKAVRYLMPTLFLLLLLLVGYSMGNGDAVSGFNYLFSPDFSKIHATEILKAMGQAFFSLSLGMGAIMIYGSYLPSSTSIPRTVVIIALADTGVALLAGLAIFPLVFQYGLTPEGGPGLIFQTLPIAFGKMPGGNIFGVLFFVLLMFAAWTSAISLLEPIVAWLVENHGMKRVKASVLAGVLAWLLGVFSLLSLNVWADKKIFGLTFFELLNHVTANIMLPLGGLLVAIFAGWSLSQETTREELGMGDSFMYRVWLFLLRYITPIGVVLIMLNALELI